MRSRPLPRDRRWPQHPGQTLNRNSATFRGRTTSTKSRDEERPFRLRLDQPLVHGRQYRVRTSSGQAREIGIGDLPVPANTIEVRRCVRERSPARTRRPGALEPAPSTCRATAALSPTRTRKRTRAPSTTGQTAKLVIPDAQSDARVWLEQLPHGRESPALRAGDGVADFYPTGPMSPGRSPSQISHAHRENRPPHVRAPRADLPGHLPRR
jgi:hypothetical protein